MFELKERPSKIKNNKGVEIKKEKTGEAQQK